MNGDIILFGGAGESERMPLPIRELGAGQKDVLSSSGLGLLLLDLNFHNFARVLDNLRDICIVSRADFTENTFDDEDDTTGKPVPPEDTDDVIAADVVVWFDHAEHAMKLPADEEDDEEMVSVPKLLESTIRTTSFLFHRKPNHNAKRGSHDPTSDTSSSSKVEFEELNNRAGFGCRREGNCQSGKVVHVGDDMYRAEEDD